MKLLFTKILIFSAVLISFYKVEASCPTAGATVIEVCNATSGNSVIRAYFYDGTAPSSYILFDLSGPTPVSSPFGSVSVTILGALPVGAVAGVEFGNVPDGDYVIRVNCSPSGTVNVGGFGINVSSGNALNVTSTLSHPDCDPTVGVGNGQLTLTVTNGKAPYTISWSGPTAIPNGAVAASGGTSTTNNNLDAGTYTATIKDASNCTFTLNNIAMPVATVAAAGSDDAICVTTYVLAGNSAGTGEIGTWTAVTAGAYTFSPNANSPTATVSGLAVGVNTFRWTIVDTGGICAPGTSDDVTITRDLSPTVVAGSPQAICGGASATLTGSSVGGSASTGAWSILSSPPGGDGVLSSTAQTATPNTVTFTANIAGAYTLRLTTDDPAGSCVAVSDDVVITVDQVPTVNAGPDSPACSATPFTLAGSSIGGSASTGAWSILSQPVGGDGVLSSTAQTSTPATVTFTATVIGAYTIRLTTDDPAGACVAVSDDVIITINQAATADAGADAQACSSIALTLTGSSVGGAALTGAWSILTQPVGGDGVLNSTAQTATPSTVTFTATVIGTYTLRLTTDDPTGPCVPATDDIVITLSLPIADAGSDTPACSAVPLTLAGTGVSGSALTGAWSILSSPPGGDGVLSSTAQTATPNTVTFNATIVGTYILRLTTDDPTGPCVPVTDDVTITVNPVPDIVPGTIPDVCSGTSSSDLPYSGTTNSPTQYRIDWDPTANGLGLADAVLTALPPTQITVSGLPTVAATTQFNGTLYIQTASGCESTGSPISVTVTANVTPSVSIVSDKGPSICAGDNVTFTATPLNGGTPTYQWKKNGADIAGETASSYVDNALLDNDQISVVMTSDILCVTSATATSNVITMTVTASVTPSVSIVSDKGPSICVSDNVTFTATPVNGGVTPTYQWQKNGVDIAGATASTYADNALVDTDKISVILTSSVTCVTSATATSNVITMTVTAIVTPSVSIVSDKGASACSTDNVTFTATPVNGGATPAYQWQKNGVDIAGATASTYADNALASNDQISVILTSSVTCVTSATATSNVITMTVTASVTPSVSIVSDKGPSICVSDNVTFTATPINGGTTPTYQWQKNGADIAGETASSYVDNALVDTDQISVILTSSIACVTSATATSNVITMTVTASVTPSVSIVSDKGPSICAGDNVTFTATPLNGGTPTYQWKKNGADIAGETASSYVDNALLDNDQISVVMTSDILCVTSATATSNVITMTVTAIVTPSVSIVSDKGTTICSTVNVTFTATPVNGGATPTYQWQKNGFDIAGATASTYADNALVDTDQISVILTSSVTCVTSATATSNTITMTVSPTPAAPSVTFTATPICVGSSFTAPVITTPAGTSTYTWYSDAALTTILTTGTAPTNPQLGFSSAAANVTKVYVTETNATTCESLATTVTLSVSDIPTALLSGNASICQGTSTDLTLVLTGSGPWDVSYSDGSSTVVISNILSSPKTITVSPTVNTTYNLVSVSNAACGPGTVSGTPGVAVTAINGDEITFGTDTWIGYVYTDAAAAAPPLSNIDFASSKYRGFIDETDIPVLGVSSYNTGTDMFDLNLGTGFVSGTNVCGSYNEDFSIRFKTRKTFAAGEYQFTVGGDDGVRLFIDGALMTLSPSNSFNTHAYTTYATGTMCLAAGQHDLIIEYFEKSGSSRVSFNYTYGVPLVDPIGPISACVNQNPAPTLTAISTTAGVTVTGYNWYSDATLLIKVATTAAYTPSATELDLTTTNSTTFYATATYACGEGPATAVIVNVINGVNTALTVAPTIDPVCSGGSSEIKITASEAGVTYQLRDDADDSLIGTAVVSAGGDIKLPTGPLTATTTFNILASAGTCSAELVTRPTVNVGGNIDTTLLVKAVDAYVCEGTGTNIQIFNSESGVTYQLRNDADDSLIGTPVAGTGLAAPILLPTGNLSTLPGVTFNILASNGTCSIEMTNGDSVKVDQIPDVSLTVDSDITGNLCVGGAGNITVDLSEVGVSYQLRDDADDSAIGAPVVGNGAKINLPTGALSVTTTFNVLATNGVCTPVELTATKTITVSGSVDLSLAVTAVDPVVCTGSATTIEITNSEAGVTYQLRNNADDSLIGAAVAGTGSTTVPLALPTGNLTTIPSITFNVLASSVTCSAELANTATVTIGTNPDATLTVTVPPATLCVNVSTSVTVVSSETGVSYQLRNDADDSLIGSAVAGTGADLPLPTGSLAATTTFNILATSGSCPPVELNSTATVNVNGTIADNLGVTANASSVCSGTATTIDVAGSDATVTYQLRDNATNAAIGTALAGNGGVLNLPTGNLTSNTTFNVLASNGTCSIQLITTASVTVTTAPDIALGVTAQNPTLCVTNTGTNIRVANSENGIPYQLRDGVTPVGTPVTGNGATIDLPTGTLSATTTFNVFAGVGTCSAQLTATASVTIISTPAVNLAVTAQNGTLCTTNTGTNIQVANSESGVSYQLRDGVTNIGTPVTGTGATIDLPTGTLSATTTFNVFANVGTCSAQLTATATVTVTSTPDISLGVTAQNPIVCTVNTGSNIQVANSQTGVSYQLRDGATNIGTPVAGTGATINLPTGNLTVTTTFNVFASLGATCSAQLTATPTVTVTSAPIITLGVSAQSPSICTNTATNIQVANSENGASYQLRNGAANVGTAVIGNGGTINLPTGSLTANTTFSVFVTIGTCSAPLTVTADVTILPSTDPACSGSATCNAVVITPVPSAATCTNSDGSVTFNINPVIAGIKIDIQGTSAGNSTITRTNFNNPVFPAIPVGVYDYTIEYGGPGCVKTGSFTIDQSGTVGTPVASSIIGPLCAGGTDGSLKLDVPNETGNLLEWSLDGILWNSFTAGNIISGLSAGSSPTFQRVISVRKTSTDPCYGSVTIVIKDQSNQAPVLAAQQPKTICSGSSTAYEILLSPLNLPAGTTFNWPDPDGAGPATAGVNVPMGVAGTVHINDVLTNATASSILVTYVVTPQLSSGCLGTSKNVVITVRSATDPLCNGGTCASVVITPVPTAAQCTLSNGAINFTITPAVPIVNNTGVKITITGISTTNSTIARTNFNNPSFLALPNGVYNYSIEYGDVSCLKTGQVTIDQSGTVGTPTASNIVGPKCAGSSTGSVTLNVPGETGNVLEWSLDGVLWNSFTAGNQITGIPAGVAPSFQKVISVRRNSTDPCNAGVTITIQDQFSPITATITPQTAATCNNNDGAVLAAFSGGDATGAGYTFELDGKTFVMPADNIIRDLSGGNHILKVIDNQLCSITLSGTEFAVTSPGLIQFITVATADPSCIGNGEDGMITVAFPTGSNEVAITQDADRSTPVFKDVPTNGVVEYKNLSKGRYYVTVKSKVNGCPNERAIDILGGPSSISFTQEMTCELGSPVLKITDINVATPGDFVFQITKLGDVTPTEVTLTQIPAGGIYYIKGSELPSATGDYEIKLMQVQGACTIYSATSRYTNRGSLTVNAANILPSYSDIATGSFSLTNFAGGTIPYYSSIRFDSAANPINEVGFETDLEEVDSDPSTFGYIKKYNKLHAGRYHVTVNEEGGCSVEFDVRVPLDFTFSINNIPNVFTPNGDGVNDFFFVRNLPAGSQLIISNRWGNEVYSSKSYQNDWGGGSAADGIYYYRLKVEGESAVTGWIEIQRGK